MGKVVGIGLDAASWELISRLIDDGRLPHLATLRARSLWCPLSGEVAYRAELPWTRFTTGHTGAENGYWSTVDFDASHYDAVEGGAHHADPFYALGSDAKVIAFDVPHTMLSPDVDGVQVTAWGAHSPQYPRASHPAGLLREIDERFGTHPAFDSDSQAGWYHEGYQQALIDAFRVGAERRVDIVQWLADKEPDWDLLLTVFSETHSGGHQFWHGFDTSHPLHDLPETRRAFDRLAETYVIVDTAIGRLLERVPADAHVVVFAVHGMRSNISDVPGLFLVPELLHRAEFGWPQLADDRHDITGPDTAPIIPRSHQRQGDLFVRRLRHHRGDDPSTAPDLVDRVRAVPDRAEVLLKARRTKRALARRVGRPTPVEWHQLAPEIPSEADVAPGSAPDAGQRLDYQGPMSYRRWWRHMRAFALPTFSDTHIRVNLAGREAEGVVPLAEYAAELDRLEAFFHACRDSRTGAPAVESVIRMRTDPFDPSGPDADLVVLFGRVVDAIEHPDVGRVGPVPFFRTGEHDDLGFALISGPAVRPDRLLEHSVTDLPPTILDLLDIANPPILAGRSFLDHPTTI